MDDIKIVVAGPEHEVYVDTILETIAEAAKVRGTGIAKRTHEYLAKKMNEAKAVIALSGDRFAGFSYIETWDNQQYVTTSGLIVHPDFRGHHIAKRIKDPLAARQDLLPDQWSGGDENEHRIRLPTRNLCRLDRRRGILERM